MVSIWVVSPWALGLDFMFKTVRDPATLMAWIDALSGSWEGWSPRVVRRG